MNQIHESWKETNAKEQAALATRPFLTRAELMAPELRMVGERPHVTTSTGIVLGGAYSKVANDPGAISGPHKVSWWRRLFQRGSR